MESQNSHVKSVQKALMLLDLLAQKNREMSLTEISNEMCWPKSTVHGLLATMRDYHYVDQSATTGYYRLGIRLFELGNIVARNWNIRIVAVPIMKMLNNQLGEMVQLGTEDKGEVLYLEKQDSTQMIRIVSEIGARLPMHCSGLGKVMLAYKRPAEVKEIIREHGLPPRTKHTITNFEVLSKELHLIQERGYALDDGEIMESLRCVAAPIYDEYGVVKYAISVSGISNSMQGEHLKEVIRSTKEAAENISFEMGYRKPSGSLK